LIKVIENDSKIMKQLFDFAMTDKTNRRGYVDLGKLSEEKIAKFGKKVVCFCNKQL
jgi:hypothetical protein